MGRTERDTLGPARHALLASRDTQALEGQLLRYLLVGGCGYLLAVSLYAALLALGAPPYPAVAATFVANGAFNFALLRAWAFPATGRAVVSELRRFGLVACVSLTVNYAGFALLFSLAGVAALPAQAIAIIGAMPVSFALNRLWSFRRAT